MRMQVIRVLLRIGIKALLDGTLGREAARQRNCDAVLEEIARKLDARKANGAASDAKPRSGRTGRAGRGSRKLGSLPRRSKPYTRAPRLCRGWRNHVRRYPPIVSKG
jgi:hypothetical protein